MVQTASHLGLRSAAATSFDFARAGDCECMACRTNLKKDKRVRNRINAFRFKKGGFTPRRRFNGPDYAAEQKKADEDNQFFSMVRVRHQQTAQAVSRCCWLLATGWCSAVL